MYIYFFLLSIYCCNSYENNKLPNYLTNVLKIPISSNLSLNEDNGSEKVFFEVTSKEKDESISYLEFDKTDKNKCFLVVQIETKNKKEGKYELDIKLKKNEEIYIIKVSYKIEYYPYTNGIGKIIFIENIENNDLKMFSKGGILVKK
jgi:hypothetical protein